VAESILRAGALIDVANLSDLALLEVVELAQQLGKPVIATRASSRAVKSRPGSFTDWQLRAIAATGGVVGISFDSDLIGAPRAELADVLRQMDHIVRVAGPDAVAISSGFETGAVPPMVLSSAARFPRLAEALLAKSTSEEQVRKLFADNALRVLCGAN
jgi:membrane dipeptidase